MSLVSDKRVEELLEKEARLDAEIERLRSDKELLRARNAELLATLASIARAALETAEGTGMSLGAAFESGRDKAITSCDFRDPCPAYRAMILIRDDHEREIERLRLERDNWKITAEKNWEMVASLSRLLR